MSFLIQKTTIFPNILPTEIHLCVCSCENKDIYICVHSAYLYTGIPSGSAGKESACSTGDLGLSPGSGRSPGEGNGNHSSILPAEFQGQRSRTGYSLWDRKVSDTTEWLTFFLIKGCNTFMYNVCVCVKVAQSCPILCDPMDYTVHGILQARILEWVAFPFSRGSSQPRDWTQVSHVAGGLFFTSWATREALRKLSAEKSALLMDQISEGFFFF